MKTICKVMAMIMCASIAAAVLSGCSGKIAENVKIEDLNKTAIDSFSSIHLDVDVAAVDIIPEAGVFAIEYHIVNQDVAYSVKEGTLTLTAEGGKVISVNKNEHSFIKIYVPEGSEFTGIDCKCDVGDIHIEKIKVDNMTIDTDVGNVTLLDIEVNENLDVETDVGNIEANLANSDCSYNFSTDVGKIVINGTEFSGIDVKKHDTSEQGPQVNLTTSTGDISFICKTS